jgi:hypothetical protein
MEQTDVVKESATGAKAAPAAVINDDNFHFGKRVTLGSRKVSIKLVNKFSILPKDPGAKFIRDEVTKKIGSSWKRGTRDVIRGLSAEEEEAYLPTVLGVRKESDQWNQKVLDFWCNFFIEVPIEGGVTLEVGFLKNPRTGKVEPISLDDYMKYNFCLEHGTVASTPDQIENRFIYDFYIVDTAKEQEKAEQLFSLSKKIDRMFIKLVESNDTKDKAKVDWILETAGGDNGVGINLDGLSDIQKQMELEKLKDKDLFRFEELITDPSLETKALIRKAVTHGIIIQDGNSYFLDSKVIGSTLQQAVGYLENAANQADKLLVTERIKQYIR